jgi:hypothetical protein
VGVIGHINNVLQLLPIRFAYQIWVVLTYLKLNINKFHIEHWTASSLVMNMRSACQHSLRKHIGPPNYVH